MLLGELFGVLAGIVVQPTPHEISVLAGVLTSPSELYLLVNLLHVCQIEVGLSGFEIFKPLFQLPHTLLQKCFESRVVGVVLYHISNRQH